MRSARLVHRRFLTSLQRLIRTSAVCSSVATPVRVVTALDAYALSILHCGPLVATYWPNNARPGELPVGPFALCPGVCPLTTVGAALLVKDCALTALAIVFTSCWRF